MKILSIRLARLLNREHQQFFIEFIALVEMFTVVKGKVLQALETLQAAFALEEAAIDKIRKSELTEEIMAADTERDHLFRGMTDVVKSALNHFDDNVRKAAKRITIVLEHYGNVALLGYDQESAAIKDLTIELREKHNADALLLGLRDWIERLNTVNELFQQLVEERYEQQNSVTDLKLVDIRREVDADYHTLVERLSALIVIEGVGDYTAFVTELNKHVTHYDTLVKEREAHNKAKQKDLAHADISEIVAHTYTGDRISPRIEVFYKGVRLTEGRDFAVEYTNNIEVGTATVTIKGKGGYAGKRVTTFNIKRTV